MSKTKGPPASATSGKASSPEARAKAVATLKARRAAKAAQMEMSLDAIPDRAPVVKRKKYKYRPNNNVELAKTLIRTALALLE